MSQQDLDTWVKDPLVGYWYYQTRDINKAIKESQKVYGDDRFNIVVTMRVQSKRIMIPEAYTCFRPEKKLTLDQVERRMIPNVWNKITGRRLNRYFDRSCCFLKVPKDAIVVKGSTVYQVMSKKEMV
jgi:hypothetical protein